MDCASYAIREFGDGCMVRSHGLVAARSFARVGTFSVPCAASLPVGVRRGI